MIEQSNNEESLKSSYTTRAQNPEISALVCLLLKNQKETLDNVHSLQKATAGLREQIQDFRAEYSEHIAELNRALQERRMNKVWIPRERF